MKKRSFHHKVGSFCSQQTLTRKWSWQNQYIFTRTTTSLHTQYFASERERKRKKFWRSIVSTNQGKKHFVQVQKERLSCAFFRKVYNNNKSDLKHILETWKKPLDKLESSFFFSPFFKTCLPFQSPPLLRRIWMTVMYLTNVGRWRVQSNCTGHCRN